MAAFDDFELSRSGVDTALPPPRSPWPAVAAVAALVIVVAAAGWYLWARKNENAAPAQVQTPPAVQPQTSTVRVPAEPGDKIDLPPLDQSDSLVRELVSRLSSHPRVAAWLTTDHLVRDFAAIVVNIAQGPTPTRHLAHVRPTGAFQVQQEGGRIRIDPRSYSRYNAYAEAVAGLDAQGAARLYATLKPRIEEAYKELGEPAGTFDRTLEQAIVRLLETPIVEGDVVLKSTSVSYSFADPELEALTPAQRQFLRMGPANMRVVRAKLREIAGFLGIPAESLPADRIVRSRG